MDSHAEGGFWDSVAVNTEYNTRYRHRYAGEWRVERSATERRREVD